MVVPGSMECGALVDAHHAVDDKWLGGSGYGGVVAHGAVAQELRVPCPGVDSHLLLAPTLKGEDDVVAQAFGLFAVSQRGCQLHVDAYAVLVAHLDVACLVALLGAEVHAVDIHAETRLVAALKTHACAAQSVARLVVCPERARRRRHGGKHSVETEGIC